MHCPSCIVDLSITERQGVEIDYCPQCRGVWLDRGELDKIIERSLDAAMPSGWQGEKKSQRYLRDKDASRERRSRGRKSFLQELFDFD